MEKQKRTIKRISVEMPDELILELKMRALRRNVTIKRYVTGALIEFLKQEKKYDK